MSSSHPGMLVAAIAVTMAMAMVTGVIFSAIALHGVDALRRGELLEAAAAFAAFVSLVALLGGFAHLQRRESKTTED